MRHNKPNYTTPFKSFSPSAPLRPGANDYKALKSGDSFGSTAKKESMHYTGTELLGIATMHKSNAVPITKTGGMAEATAKMRRG
jgi:hypothetical protein